MVNLTRESIAQEFYKSKKAEDGHAIYMPYTCHIKSGDVPRFLYFIRTIQISNVKRSMNYKE